MTIGNVISCMEYTRVNADCGYLPENYTDREYNSRIVRIWRMIAAKNGINFWWEEFRIASNLWYFVQMESESVDFNVEELFGLELVKSYLDLPLTDSELKEFASLEEWLKIPEEINYNDPSWGFHPDSFDSGFEYDSPTIE